LAIHRLIRARSLAYPCLQWQREDLHRPTDGQATLSAVFEPIKDFLVEQASLISASQCRLCALCQAMGALVPSHMSVLDISVIERSFIVVGGLFVLINMRLT
jgi:hypothetical protein